MRIHAWDHGQPAVVLRSVIFREHIVWNRCGRASNRERADAIWSELVVVDHVVVVEADVAFPLLRATVDLERLRIVVVVRCEAAVDDATVCEHCKVRVLRVLPLASLAAVCEVQGAVAGVRDQGEVRLEVVIPVAVNRCSNVVGVVVVVRERKHVGAHFRWANKRLRVEGVLHDAGRVHLAVVIEREVFRANAWGRTNAVDETWGWERSVRRVKGHRDEALVDLLKLRRVLHALGRGTSLTERWEEDGEQEGDDAHDDEQLDKCEAALAVGCGVILHGCSPDENELS